MKIYKQLQVQEEKFYQNIKKLQEDFITQKAQRDLIRKVIRNIISDLNVPGPGSYNETNNLSNSGKYISSRNTGFGKRLFDKEKRVNDIIRKAVRNGNPGPGSYQMPSDFGQYDGDVYNTISFNDRSKSS